MKTISLVTFHKLESARVLRDQLQAAGVPAVIHDESKLQRFWFMSAPLAAVHIEVPQPQYLEARRLVEVWDKSDGALHDAVRCPDCHSSRVEFPQMPRKFISLINLIPLLMMIGVIKRRFYCYDCHYTWSLADTSAPKREPLGWPSYSDDWHSERQHSHH